MKVNGKPVWISYIDTNSGSTKGIVSQTNSFCAAGSTMSNGTMINLGGTPATTRYNDGNGLQAIRMFPECGDNGCYVCSSLWSCPQLIYFVGQLYENESRMHLTSRRWYPASVRLQDGSVFIMGGMTTTGFNNAPSTDNPTSEYLVSSAISQLISVAIVEYFPPKNIAGYNGLEIPSRFLKDALKSVTSQTLLMF